MSEPQPETEAPSKGKALLLPILVVLNLLVVAGLGGLAYFTLKRAPAQAAAPAEHGEGHGGGENHSFGPLVELEPLITNLQDPTAERYIKTTIRLEVEDEHAKARVEAGIVPIRDRMISALSALTVEEALGPENQAEIRERLLTIANETLGSHLVRHVYFVELVIQ